jgi:predicted glycogen debranching enzyme
MEYNTADASLWFIEALNRYYLLSRDEEKSSFVKEMLPTVNRIVESYLSPAGSIYMDRDNLVVVPAQWTWMDAIVAGNPVTPRNGKPVEIQALMFNALGIADRFNRLVGGRKSAERYGKLREDVGDTINSRFFKDFKAYPYDVIDGDAHGAAVRPNALLLMSLSDADNLLTPDKKEAILDVARQELLTPYGLRTLSPRDPAYIGRYDTFAPMAVKDLAYHQGTVWPYLLSHYAMACRNARPDLKGEDIRGELEPQLQTLLSYVLDNGTLPEVFAGDAPHAPGGAVSQAWSVAALLELFDILNAPARHP